jgi:hypothetical protein
MFALGNFHINEYRLWVTAPVFTLDPNSTEAKYLPYYEVLLFKKIPNWSDHYSYLDPVKAIFKLEMTDRNPLSRPKDKESLTQEELEFRVESNSYNNRRDMGMPLVLLSKRHVEELLQVLSQ